MTIPGRTQRDPKNRCRGPKSHGSAIRDCPSLFCFLFLCFLSWSADRMNAHYSVLRMLKTNDYVQFSSKQLRQSDFNVFNYTKTGSAKYEPAAAEQAPACPLSTLGAP